MDDQLRPDLFPPRATTLTALVAPLAQRRHDAPPSLAGGREELGPPLFSTALVTVGRWRCPPDHAVFADSGPARGHLFVFPRSSVWIQHEGGPRFVADPATVTFYNHGQRYRRFALSPAGDRGEWFAVAPGVLADVLARHDRAAGDRGDRPFSVTHGPSDRRSYLAQRAVYEHVCRQEAPDTLFVEETMLRVLDRVAGLALARHAARRPVPRAAARDLVEHTREVLAERFAEPISLLELARAVGCSPFHLARLFRSATATSLHGHRTELRLRAALERLGDSRCDLLDLALSLGYASHSHFTEVFRAAFGTTPSDLRGRLTRGRARDLAPACRIAPATGRRAPWRR